MKKGVRAGTVIDIEPMHAFEGLEPGPLALGQAPAVDLDVFNGLIKGLFPLQMLNDFGVANGGLGLFAQGLVCLEQGFYFLHQTGLDHAKQTGRSPVVRTL